MAKMILPMELYHAARETCIRLYVANGGDPRAKWTIQPYPGTAAIACDKGNAWTPPSFRLCMPSFPLDVRLPRWKSDLVGAYTVHELLHALWTDWNAVAQSRRDGLHNLCNALEDCRIEAKASHGDLIQVSEARRLLEALNAHIIARAMSKPEFALDDPAQFSFVIGLAIFSEKLGYRSTFPADWRAKVNPDWLPMIDHALARFDGLASTGDVLRLAHELRAMAAARPKTKSNLPKPAPAPQRAPEPGDMGEPMPASEPAPRREAEIVEDAPEGASEPASEPNASDASEDASEGEKGAGEPLEGEGEGEGKGEDAPAPQGEPMPADDAPAENNEVKTEGAPDAPGGRGAQTEMESEPEPAADLSDATQVYEEANLDDLARDAARNAGKRLAQVQAMAQSATIMLNVEPHNEVKMEAMRGGDPKRAGAAIASPAKLRRHLTLAVKSPERVAVERRQVSGRLDLRNLAGIEAGAENIFRRRIEDEGREAAVTLLLDVSGSMKGHRLAAAKAMAMHMGDALKAAGVKFEICAFDDHQLWTPKPFAKGWNVETRRAVAGMQKAGGTAMLPALKQCAERLLKVGGVTRRILLALTDGQDGYPVEANAALCAYYAARGVEIVGIGLMTGKWIEAPFNGRAVNVWDCASLSTIGLGQLVRALDEGAPRTG